MSERESLTAALKCQCGCGRDAVVLGSGRDYDGTEFVDEPMCRTAAEYCAEAAGEARLPFSTKELAG